MQSMQSKVLANIEKIITDAKLDAVEQSDYANTGTIFAMKGLDTIVSVRYQFDTEACSLRFKGWSVERAGMAKTIEDNPPLYRLQRLANGLELGFLSLRYDNGTRLALAMTTLGTLVAQ